MKRNKCQQIINHPDKIWVGKSAKVKGQTWRRLENEITTTKNTRSAKKKTNNSAYNVIN
jgi:hypothetical protein